ncbi:MAG: protein kinase [Lachnospiraceae bacterium]|nr:protein kinase [Lachnospiraceae bacterium]
MTLEEECRLSFYEEKGKLGEKENVSLVRHIETGEFFVCKIVSVHDVKIYRYLRDHHIQGTPVIYDLIEDWDRLIVVEEYISGDDLKQVLRKHGKPPVKWAEGMLLQLCSIVERLHAVVPPIIHRDIKPSNIMITEGHEVRLLDMDAARLSKTGGEEDTTLMGTRGYAAPEQYGFGQSDERTDVYAIGMVMKELLPGTGRYGRIIKKATAIDPGKRYRSVKKLREAL